MYSFDIATQDLLPSGNSARPNSQNLIAFRSLEVDMMLGDWAEAGNPTPYELRTTLHTCRRLWQLNKDALAHPDCDYQMTEHNILILEKLHIHLMDYLVE